MDATLKDAKSIRSRYPHQLLLALTDDTVLEALEKRFVDGEALTDISLLPLQGSTGLIPLCFTFAPSSSVMLAGTSILVHVDHRCRVTLADDDFVPARPNPVSGDVAARDTAPLALAARDGERRRPLATSVVLEQQRLASELLVHHGLLSQVKSADLGPTDYVYFETDCLVETTTYVDTTYTVVVKDENGNIVDQFEDYQQDESKEEQTMADDSGQMTVGDLVDHYGHF
jgi:hypothetical protein